MVKSSAVHAGSSLVLLKRPVIMAAASRAAIQGRDARIPVLCRNGCVVYPSVVAVTAWYRRSLVPNDQQRCAKKLTILLNDGVGPTIFHCPFVSCVACVCAFLLLCLLL